MLPTPMSSAALPNMRVERKLDMVIVDSQRNGRRRALLRAVHVAARNPSGRCARKDLAATPPGVISPKPIPVLDPSAHELLDSRRRTRLDAGLRSGILQPRSSRHRL